MSIYKNFLNKAIENTNNLKQTLPNTNIFNNKLPVKPNKANSIRTSVMEAKPTSSQTQRIVATANEDIV